MRIKITMVKIIIIVFSITESTIVGLPISQNNGLNRAVKIATGATLLINLLNHQFDQYHNYLPY